MALLGVPFDSLWVALGRPLATFGSLWGAMGSLLANFWNLLKFGTHFPEKLAKIIDFYNKYSPAGILPRFPFFSDNSGKMEQNGPSQAGQDLGSPAGG